MSRIAASLAAVLLASAVAGCGGGGAEPDAPSGGAHVGALEPLTLVLDFQPNAVHAGIYAAIAEGYTAAEGIDLGVREPGSSSDGPKLLAAGRVDAAVMDIHDLAIARGQGADLVGVGAIVQRPLAAVIARDRDAVRTPAELAGRQIGVTGLPSDDAVLDTVLAAGGLEPGDVERTTVGFESVPALAAGRLDAATAFWNAEGDSLRELGVPTRVFRVDAYGAPRYPELVLVTTGEELDSDRESISGLIASLQQGYGRVLDDPAVGLDDLLAAVPGLEPGAQKRQLSSLLSAFGPPIRLNRGMLERWADWEVDNGIVDERPDVGAAFDFKLTH